MIVLAIVDDLVFQARIQAVAAPLGVEVGGTVLACRYDPEVTDGQDVGVQGGGGSL